MSITIVTRKSIVDIAGVLDTPLKLVNTKSLDKSIVIIAIAS